MEPFGLLNLLKSLLPQTENSTHPTPEKTDGDSGEKPLAQPTPPSDERSNASNDLPDGANNRQNAFLDYVNRHDERKKQIKKD